MYGFTQRLFPVPYEWGRLVRVVAVSSALVAARRAAAADRRLRRPALRGRALARSTRSRCSPPASSRRASARWLARLRQPGELVAELRALRPAAAAVDGSVPETYEAEQMDEDARLT